MTVGEVAADCDTIEVRLNEGGAPIATVALARPDVRNALNEQLRAELKEIIRTLEDGDTQVIILTGSEEAGAFAAGADVGELRERGVMEQRKASERPRIYDVIEGCSLPVIARVNGHAVGGGCELMLACDIRIAHVDAKVGQPEINLGIIPGGGSTQRLPRLIGEGQAMRLILSGDLIDAREAADIGLVDAVHDDESFDERVYDLAKSIAGKSPQALEHAKTAIQAASRMDLDAGIDYEAELFAQLFATEDKNEGIDAFLEGRDPEWQGR